MLARRGLSLQRQDSVMIHREEKPNWRFVNSPTFDLSGEKGFSFNLLVTPRFDGQRKI
jgi:hypothetical protein